MLGSLRPTARALQDSAGCLTAESPIGRDGGRRPPLPTVTTDAELEALAAPPAGATALSGLARLPLDAVAARGVIRNLP